jgi:signal transduction histidine kinase
LLLETGSAFSHTALIARLREAQLVITDLTARVRTLSLDLRPSMLDDLGLLPTLLWHFERYTSQTQVHVAFKHRGLDQSLDPLITIAVYRVVQEALTNVARYAQVGVVSVAVWIQGCQVVVSIEDQGRGFDLEAVLAARHSSGLAGMQERVVLLGGQMMIDTAPGQGTRLLVELPLNRPESMGEAYREWLDDCAGG